MVQFSKIIELNQSVVINERNCISSLACCKSSRSGNNGKPKRTRKESYKVELWIRSCKRKAASKVPRRVPKNVASRHLSLFLVFHAKAGPISVASTEIYLWRGNIYPSPWWGQLGIPRRSHVHIIKEFLPNLFKLYLLVVKEKTIKQRVTTKTNRIR